MWRSLASSQLVRITVQRYYYAIRLDEDWRGPKRVRERHRIRQVVQRLVDSHPLYG